MGKASVEQMYHRVYLENISDHAKALEEHILKKFDLIDAWNAVDGLIEFEIRNLRHHIAGDQGIDLREPTATGWLARDLEMLMFPKEGNNVLWHRSCPINDNYCMRHAERLLKKGYRGKDLSRRACAIMEVAI